MTIQVRVRVLTTVDTEEVKLPFCFSTSEYSYSCECVMITEDLKIVKVFSGDTHNSMSISQRTDEQVQEYLEDIFKRYSITEMTTSEFQERINKFISQTTDIK
jgi:tRNA U54 and U55 pseudouridine synthase Pus10